MRINRLERSIRELAGSLRGKASVFIETEEGTIQLAANEPFPAASLIKIPIMLAAYRQAQLGLLDLSKKHLIPESMRVGGMGVIAHLSAELSLSLQDLIALMMMVSDNTATNMVIDQVGIDAVNRLAVDLQCYQTVLGRRMMDWEAAKAGKDNLTSAANAVRFLQEITSGKILNEAGKKAAYHTLLHQQFQTKLPALVTGSRFRDVVIAHKTGELPGTEHDAGIISIHGRRAYVAVLTTGLEDNADGRRFIANIGKRVADYLLG
ncbi:serine hydrolase [Brevibacillus sp. B_LB10_24]|uniref:serine hydrolase n=1 Tax=Brevibacillus sp. B_LB10_24 TaxID=3380645 RepID=UPI0038BA168F